MLDSVIIISKYYPQTLSEECKHEIKNIMENVIKLIVTSC